MKVLFVPDVYDWAIGHLVNQKVKYLKDRLNCRVFAVHPRDALQRANDFARHVKSFKPDLIIYEYFRTAQQLIEACPELKKYKSLLVHHNQRGRALKHADWNELGFETLVVHTENNKKRLGDLGYTNVEVINHGIDLKDFPYSDKEPEEPMVGYVGRIVAWKGLREIAQACKDSGHKLTIMGKQDDADYWAQIDKENLDFSYFGCKDEERKDAYQTMTIYVGNSLDNYEEGTLPLLEAMASGVPVVTTPNGVAKDIIEHEKNGLIVPFEDSVALKEAIDRLMSDKDLRDRLRQNAFGTVRKMTEEHMAWRYQDLIYKTIFKKQDVVSVVIPITVDRELLVPKLIKAFDEQTHKAVEVIFVFDEIGIPKDVKQRLEDWKLDAKIPIKFMCTGEEGYGLAKARNIGSIESHGEYLMFCDSRMCPEKDAVEQFLLAKKLNENSVEKSIWLFGDKGSQKRSFVENFSFVSRYDFFKWGMFNERIDGYGGMSQEIRTRWLLQGGDFVYVNDAIAKELQSSHLSDKKRVELVDMKLKLFKMYKDKAQ